MSSNKNAKDQLIKLYGAECFIEKLHLRMDDTPRHYKSKAQKKRMQQLTYHHIREKSKGGKATIENGALLSVENHEWFNSQTKEIQTELNQKFQEYKNCKVVFVEDLKPDYKINIAEIIPTETELVCDKINVYENMTEKEIEYYKEYKKQRNERVFKKFEKEVTR